MNFFMKMKHEVILPKNKQDNFPKLIHLSFLFFAHKISKSLTYYLDHGLFPHYPFFIFFLHAHLLLFSFRLLPFLYFLCIDDCLYSL